MKVSHGAGESCSRHRSTAGICKCGGIYRTIAGNNLGFIKGDAQQQQKPLCAISRENYFHVFCTGEFPLHYCILYVLVAGIVPSPPRLREFCENSCTVFLGGYADEICGRTPSKAD